MRELRAHEPFVLFDGIVAREVQQLLLRKDGSRTLAGGMTPNGAELCGPIMACCVRCEMPCEM